VQGNVQGRTIASGRRRSRRRGAAAVAAGMLVVAACTDREVTEPDPQPVTQAGVDAAVLSADDLPGGSDAGPGPGVAAELLPNLPCDDFLADLDPELEASRTLRSAGVEISSTVAWFPDNGAGTANRILEVRSECRRAAEPGTGRQVRADPLRFGALTNRVGSIKLELEPTTGPITEIAVIVARDGDLLHVLRATGERPVSRDLLDTATREAIAKLSALALETGQ
jgi:hypothetical protein